MLQRPAVGFHQLMLGEEHGFEIARFGAAAAAVGNRAAEGALVIKNAGAVADERAYGGARSGFALRHGQIARRAGVGEKKIAAVGPEIEQTKKNARVLIGAGFDRDGLAPEKFAGRAGGRGFEPGFDGASVAPAGDHQSVVARLIVRRVVDQKAVKARFADRESNFYGRRIA